MKNTGQNSRTIAFAQKGNIGSKEREFIKKVLMRLAEMLTLLKMGDRPENRKKFQNHCQYLLDLGKEAKYWGWVELLEVAKAAIAVKLNNPYETTAKLIIKEIKEASELVKVRNIEGIIASKQLQKLVPEPRLKPLDIQTIGEELATNKGEEIKTTEGTFQAQEIQPNIKEEIWDGKETITSEIWDGKETIINEIWDGKETITREMWDGKETITREMWDGKETITREMWDGKETITSDLTPLDEIESNLVKNKQEELNNADKVEDLLNLFNDISEEEEAEFFKNSLEEEKENDDEINKLFNSFEEENEQEDNLDFLNLDFDGENNDKFLEKNKSNTEINDLATLLDLDLQEQESSLELEDEKNTLLEDLGLLLDENQLSIKEEARSLEIKQEQEIKERDSFDELALLLGENQQDALSEAQEEKREEENDSFDELALLLGENQQDESHEGQEKKIEQEGDDFDELALLLGENQQDGLSETQEEKREEENDSFDELALLLGENKQDESHEEQEEKREEEGDDFDELALLLETNKTNEQQEDESVEDLLENFGEKLVTNKQLYFYEQLEELEQLIESKEKIEDVDFEELENIINSKIEISEDTLEKEIEEEDAETKELIQETENLFRKASEKSGINLVKPPSRRDSKAFEQTMRVSVKELDNLNNLIGELVVKRNRLEQDQERLRQFLDNLLNHVQNLGDIGKRMHDLYERNLLERALLATRNQGFSAKNHQIHKIETPPEDQHGFDALEMDSFTGFHTLSQEMIELTVRIREASEDIQFLVDENEQVARTLRQVTTQLQEGMNKSRMVPFSQNADRLPRAIRDISRKLNKNAELKVEGREVLIDKMILEHLNDPMTHLVNNAITHGIQTPEERKKQGKPISGTITVRAFLQGNQTVISVSDDGAGIDKERVKQKAVEKGLITKKEAKSLSEQEIYDFLFHPGFSTKDKADDFAGRGVGLDVVRKNLSEIRGTVSIDSTLGKGTTFNIRLPLTLSICKALCCISDNALIGFPMDGVEDIIETSRNKIEINPEELQCVHWRDTLLPFQNLNNLLGYNRKISRSSIYSAKKEEDQVSIVVLRGAGSLLAIEVDQVLPGEEEIVIKQIEGPVPKPPGIAGATVLGDGRVMPIGDVLELIEIATGRRSRDLSDIFVTQSGVRQHQGRGTTEPVVLIVDDSITVREVLSGSFTKAGYRVEQARDGQEALEKLSSGLPCDIVFCDIEMPKMNGLELLSKMQKDENLSDIPVALLTSRGAERHRKVAADLGASGYFTKPYIETDLLDAAARMIKGEVLLSSSNKTSPSKENPVINKKQQRSQPETPIQELIVAPKLINQKSKSQAAIDDSKSKGKKNKYEQTVLIVDDSIVVREMLSTTFKKAGYQVEQARDGLDAWNKLRAGLPCDVILCDIEMPKMNGLDFLLKMQSDEHLSKLPVAMVTSRGAEKHRNIAAERGAKAYFTKPYLEDELLKAVARLIEGELLLAVK